MEMSRIRDTRYSKEVEFDCLQGYPLVVNLHLYLARADSIYQLLRRSHLLVFALISALAVCLSYSSLQPISLESLETITPVATTHTVSLLYVPTVCW